MTMAVSRWLFAGIALLGVCAATSLGQETTLRRPPPPELESFLVMPRGDFFNAYLSGWATYNVMHRDWNTFKAAWVERGRAERIHVWQCRATARMQQQTARDYAPYADLYTHWAFLCTSAHKPADGELVWGEFDDPFINHLRQMRELVGTTPIVAVLLPDFGVESRRPAILEEVQWQFIAVAGCGYRGVLWPVPYNDTAMGDEFKQIGEQIKKYGRFMAQAQAVNWAKAAEDQPISSLACDDYLFVFLLNPAYMKFDPDGEAVSVPLDRPLCEGSVTLTLPAGLKVRRGRTLLGGNTLRVASEDGKTTIPFSFKTGGEMMIFALSGEAGLAAATQPTTKPAATQPADTEITR